MTALESSWMARFVTSAWQHSASFGLVRSGRPGASAAVVLGFP